jgi:hypothetical protein
MGVRNKKIFGPRTAKDYRKCMYYMFLGSELSVATATVFGMSWGIIANYRFWVK